MKFLCPHCERLSSLEDFEVTGSALMIRCAACSRASRVERRTPAAPPLAEAPGRVSAPAAVTPSPVVGSVLALVRPRPAAEVDGVVPAGFCPKCIAPREAAGLTCPSCGLVFENFRAADFELSPELAVLWGLAWEAGPDDAAFRHLLATAHLRGELPLIGRRYRIRLAHDPHDVVAQRGREEVLRLASTGDALRPDPGTSAEVAQRRGKTILLVALFFLVCILFYLARVVLRMSTR